MKVFKLFAAAAVAAVLAVSCGVKTSEVKVEAKLPTKAEIDTVSYLIGVNFGSFIKGNNFASELKELNMASIKKGMEDFLKAEGSPYDPEFAKQFSINLEDMGKHFDNFLTKRAVYEAEVTAAKNKAYLQKNALKEDVDTLASGLQYTIIEAGSSEKIEVTDTLVVNYKGSLIDGTVFDERESETFILDGMIRGWQEGLTLIGEGGKIKLVVPANLAYGPRGNGEIKPNSILLFDVEVLKVSKAAPVEVETEVRQ